MRSFYQVYRQNLIQNGMNPDLVMPETVYDELQYADQPAIDIENILKKEDELSFITESYYALLGITPERETISKWIGCSHTAEERNNAIRSILFSPEFFVKNTEIVNNPWEFSLRIRRIIYTIAFFTYGKLSDQTKSRIYRTYKKLTGKK